MEGIEEAFQFYDTKGDSKIAASQIGNCLRSLNLTPTEGLIERMTQQWKDQPEARVSIEEFTPIYKNVKKESGKPPTVEQFQNLLAHFDRDGNGVVMLPDLRYMLQNSVTITHPLNFSSYLEARVSIEEFTPIYKNVKKESGKPPTVEQFQNLLAHFDRDGNGVVMLPDLRYMLQNSGERLSGREVDTLLSNMEIVEGRVPINEFVRMIMS
ncbi:EF hand [Ancylostoma caninum]|uniref:EF hand n=1 Tax=Ancylostoma caninum TaxID=29170 RepID=A0A368GNT9_ANCCA|nr:EF hand [Ancylostoma caninum]